MIQRVLGRSAFRSGEIRTLSSLLVFIVVFSTSISAQIPQNLHAVKKLYVGPLGTGKWAAAVRQRMVDRLRAGRKIVVVEDLSQADASVAGSCEIWITGYVSPSVRAASSNRRPVYTGFLSTEVIGKRGTTLWSYLVTPRKFPFKGIVDDLADQLVGRLLEAVDQVTPAETALASSEGDAAISLHGAGATFPWPLYKKWFESYEQKYPRFHIRYEPVGSETGIRLLRESAVDFAGSDMPLSDQAMAQSGTKFLHFATALGAVVPIYHLDDLDRYLNFTPEALAGIYSGAIKKWNDPAIREVNPGVHLPDSEITVIHRSDGSGTTFVWTDYLSKTNREFRDRIGAATMVRWPVGMGAERNEGVAEMVRQKPNSIGYVELIYAIQRELSFGAVRNRAGRFVRADLNSVTAAASSLSASVTQDFRVSLTDASGKNAYPISSFTWVLLPEKGDTRKTTELYALLRWMLTYGQKQCGGLGYAPLPAEVSSRELGLLDALK